MRSEGTAGLDLGTTFSAIAHIDPGTRQPTLINNSSSERLTPSVVYLGEEILVGQAAIEEAEAEPENAPYLVRFVKRSMGNSTRRYRSKTGREYSPEEVSAEIIKKLVSDARRSFSSIEQVLISVPAYYTMRQRTAVLRAGELAGVGVLGLIAEPTAAAVAYGLFEKDRKQYADKVMVYDLGGGTFDVTIAQVHATGLDVLGVYGHPRLGGKDFDDRIVNWVRQQCEQRGFPDPNADPETRMVLQERATTAKHRLSDERVEQVRIDLDLGRRVSFQLRRVQFEEMIRPLVMGSIEACQYLLSDLKMTWKDINKIMLVGGSTRIPLVRRLLCEASGEYPQLKFGYDPDTLVALGAAIRAPCYASLPSLGGAGSYPGFSDVLDSIPFNFGVMACKEGVRLFVPMIQRYQKSPTTIKRTFFVPPGDTSHVVISLMEGLGAQYEENETIGSLQFGPFPPRRREPRPLEIELCYDLQRGLKVRVSDPQTKEEISHRIEM